MLTAQHLNQIAVLHVHKNITHDIDFEKLMNTDTLEQKSLISTFNRNDDIGITEEKFCFTFSWNTAFTVVTNQIRLSQK